MSAQNGKGLAIKAAFTRLDNQPGADAARHPTPLSCSLLPGRSWAQPLPQTSSCLPSC